MADPIERLRLQAKIGLIDAANTPGHVVVSYDEAAAEIERLQSELSSARALLARYEQAPVVGWSCADLNPTFESGFANILLRSCRSPKFCFPLIVRPEPSK